MKAIYFVTTEMEEGSMYFVEMTDQEASEMRQTLALSGCNFMVTPIRKVEGFNTFHDLMHDFRQMAYERKPRPRKVRSQVLGSTSGARPQPEGR